MKETVREDKADNKKDTQRMVRETARVRQTEIVRQMEKESVSE